MDGRTDQPTDTDVVNRFQRRKCVLSGWWKGTNVMIKGASPFRLQGASLNIHSALQRRKLHSVTSSNTGGKNEWPMAKLQLYELGFTYVLFTQERLWKVPA